MPHAPSKAKREREREGEREQQYTPESPTNTWGPYDQGGRETADRAVARERRGCEGNLTSQTACKHASKQARRERRREREGEREAHRRAREGTQALPEALSLHGRTAEHLAAARWRSERQKDGEMLGSTSSPHGNIEFQYRGVWLAKPFRKLAVGSCTPGQRIGTNLLAKMIQTMASSHESQVLWAKALASHAMTVPIFASEAGKTSSSLAHSEITTRYSPGGCQSCQESHDCVLLACNVGTPGGARDLNFRVRLEGTQLQGTANAPRHGVPRFRRQLRQGGVTFQARSCDSTESKCV